jgi:hypothetical protein
MIELWFTYRDVKGFERKKIERLATPQPGDLRIRDQVFPAGAGFPAMHIKTHHITVGQTVVHLITYTEERLSIRAAAELAELALQPPPKEPSQ